MQWSKQRIGSRQIGITEELEELLILKISKVFNLKCKINKTDKGYRIRTW